MEFLTGAIDANTRFAHGDIRGVESRFSPENLPHNLALVELVKRWAERKQATPAQIALAWLMAQKPWIVPIPGTTQMAHMLENIGAAAVRSRRRELAELNAAGCAIEIRGRRLPDAVLVFSGVEAPERDVKEQLYMKKPERIGDPGVSALGLGLHGHERHFRSATPDRAEMIKLLRACA